MKLFSWRLISHLLHSEGGIRGDTELLLKYEEGKELVRQKCQERKFVPGGTSTAMQRNRSLIQINRAGIFPATQMRMKPLWWNRQHLFPHG